MKNIAILIYLLLLCACTQEEEDQFSTILISSGKIKTVHGNIEVELYDYKAPQTVDRIKTLVKMGFYNGLAFHRVVPKTLVQTGSPDGKQHGGTGKNIIFEKNDIPLEKGAIAMARESSDLNSADSQFFIALEDMSSLSYKYTVFGKVVNGLEVLNQLKLNDKIIFFNIK